MRFQARVELAPPHLATRQAVEHALEDHCEAFRLLLCDPVRYSHRLEEGRAHVQQLLGRHIAKVRRRSLKQNSLGFRANPAVSKRPRGKMYGVEILRLPRRALSVAGVLVAKFLATL